MGTSNDAEKEAKKSERSRQAGIADATSRINAAYDSPSRTAQYADFGNALRDYYMGDATRQKEIADRNLKFSLAKAGQTGGSLAVDSGKTLADEYARGILNAEQKTQAGVSDLQAQDEASRLNLTQLAQSGLDATTAAARAMSGIQSNAQQAQGNAFANGLGDIFGTTASIYQKQNQAVKERKQADQISSMYAKSPWGP